MRIYNAHGKLEYIECDRCGTRITPHPEISESGWFTHGVYHGPGDARNTSANLCPACAASVVDIEQLRIDIEAADRRDWDAWQRWQRWQREQRGLDRR